MKFQTKLIKSFLKTTALILLIPAAFIPAQQKGAGNHQSKKDSTLVERQHMIHSRSHMVMPFDMSKVTHYFIKTKTGGVLKIKAKNKGDEAQIKMIRNHLSEESKLFSNADFRDPKKLHGKNMPGLKILSNSAGKYSVKYEEIPSGAEIIFNSKDKTVIRALHSWFDAQLKDHGKDARSSDK